MRRHHQQCGCQHRVPTATRAVNDSDVLGDNVAVSPPAYRQCVEDGKTPRCTGAARHRSVCSSCLLRGVASDNRQRLIDQHQRRLVLKEYKTNVAFPVAGDARLD